MPNESFIDENFAKRHFNKSELSDKKGLYCFDRDFLFEKKKPWSKSFMLTRLVHAKALGKIKFRHLLDFTHSKQEDWADDLKDVYANHFALALP